MAVGIRLPFIRFYGGWAYALGALAALACIVYGEGFVVVPRGLSGLGTGLSLQHVGALGLVANGGLLLRRLAAAPVVSIDALGMVARTNPWLERVTLGGWSRQLVIDRTRKLVHLQVRVAWLLHGEVEIPFSRISHVEYRYLGSGGAIDAFDVALVLTDGTKEHLFRFRGEVAEHASASREEGLSQAFVDALCRMTGKGITPQR